MRQAPGMPGNEQITDIIILTLFTYMRKNKSNVK